jgi:hypothetical protein
MARIVEEAQAGWRTEIAARPLDASAPVRRAVELAAAVACAAVFFDVVVTWAALHESIAWEQNPVVASVMREIGVAPTLALGGLLRAAIVAGLTFLARWATRGFVRVTAAVVLGAVALWWTAVVFANAVFLGHLG